MSALGPVGPGPSDPPPPLLHDGLGASPPQPPSAAAAMMPAVETVAAAAPPAPPRLPADDKEATRLALAAFGAGEADKTLVGEAIPFGTGALVDVDADMSDERALLLGQPGAEPLAARLDRLLSRHAG